jgi:hypothetical protein
MATANPVLTAARSPDASVTSSIEYKSSPADFALPRVGSFASPCSFRNLILSVIVCEV